MNNAELDYLNNIVNELIKARDILNKQINDQLYFLNKRDEESLKISTPDKQDGLIKPAKDYFSDKEYFNCKHLIDPNILWKNNLVRENWRAPIIISPIRGAVIRNNGKSDKSMHNIDYWGKVRATDFFPQSKIHAGGINTASEMLEFVKLLRKCGFTGIGIYPHFSPSWGVHADNRPISCEWVDAAKYPQHNYVYGELEDLLKKYK